MYKIERGSFTPGGTPPFNTTVLFSDSTLLANKITLSTGPSSSSGVDSICHTGDGLMTPTQQSAKATIFGGSAIGGVTEQRNNKCILHYNVISGANTKVLSASRVSMATPGEFTINVDVLSGTQPIYYVAEQF